MNVEFPTLLIKVVQPWSHWCQDIVRFEANHIMQETSELVNLTFDLNVWSRVFLEERIVLIYFALMLIQLVQILINNFPMP
jgi:hypothetical protein